LDSNKEFAVEYFDLMLMDSVEVAFIDRIQMMEMKGLVLDKLYTVIQKYNINDLTINMCNDWIKINPYYKYKIKTPQSNQNDTYNISNCKTVNLIKKIIKSL